MNTYYAAVCYQGLHESLHRIMAETESEAEAKLKAHYKSNGNSLTVEVDGVEEYHHDWDYRVYADEEIGEIKDTLNYEKV